MNNELSKAREDLEIVNAKLKEIDQLKSAFISVITHELRTPLANLGFALQIFELYGLENFSTEQKGQLEELHQGMIAARKMVDDLVTFASFLNEQGELTLDDIDIRDVVMNAVKSHQTIAQDKGIRLKLDVSGTNFIFRADSKLLTNAIHHLINNAVKFTGEGGAVIVSCWTKVEGLVINVRDTGIGISSERMENIWDAFVSTSNPLQRGWEGLGIGLALVKLIVEAHGGIVWAQSELGKGSDFGFQIPLVAQARSVNK
jgi:signal transduction histidine kinase